jgi:hypothetical protein
MTITPSPLETRVRRVLAAWPGLTFETLEDFETQRVRVRVRNRAGTALGFAVGTPDDRILFDATRWWGPPPAPEPWVPKVGDFVRVTAKRIEELSEMRASISPDYWRGRALLVVGVFGTYISVDDDKCSSWSIDQVEPCPPPQTSPVGSEALSCSVPTGLTGASETTQDQPASLPEPAKCSRCLQVESSTRMVTVGRDGRATCEPCIASMQRVADAYDSMFPKTKRHEGYGLDRKPIAPRFPEPTQFGMVGRVGGRMATRFK